MNQLLKLGLFWGLFFVMGLMTGCSSDSGDDSGGTQWVTYTGSTSQATIDDSNAQALSMAPYSNLEKARANNDGIEVLQGMLPGLLAGTYDECGGSYSQQFESASSGTIIFNDYCVMTGVDQVTLNGSVYASQSGQAQTMKMSNLSVNVNGTEYIVSGTFVREGTSFTMDFVGVDGKTYRIEDLVVQESTTVAGGVNIISGRFYHPDHGYVDMHSSSPIVSETCGDVLRPTSGKVIVEGANGTDGSVEYLGCAEYMVCTNQDSTCETLPW
jgi:hypothetical protein